MELRTYRMRFEQSAFIKIYRHTYLRFTSTGTNTLYCKENPLISPQFETNAITFSNLLHSCSNIKELRNLHANMVVCGFGLNAFLCAKLLNMYAKCGNLKDARQVFDKMPERDVVSWTAMIAGYAQNGCANEALTLFDQLPLEGIKPNSFTVVSALRACAQLGALQQGMCFHGMQCLLDMPRMGMPMRP